jgi:hypothetical protein
MDFFCKYKNSLGIPGKGVHVHYMGIAYKDVIGTILIAVLIAFLYHMPLWIAIGGMFVLGILLHRLFCVRTTIDKLLFG